MKRMHLDADGRRCLLSLERAAHESELAVAAMSRKRVRFPLDSPACSTTPTRSSYSTSWLTRTCCRSAGYLTRSPSMTSPRSISPSATCACSRPAMRSRNTASSTSQVRRRVAALGRHHAARLQTQSAARSRGQLLAQSHSRVAPLAIRLNSMGASWKRRSATEAGRARNPRSGNPRLIVQPLNLPAAGGGERTPARRACASRASANGRGSHREAGVSPPSAKNCRLAPAATHVTPRERLRRFHPYVFLSRAFPQSATRLARTAESC